MRNNENNGGKNKKDKNEKKKLKHIPANETFAIAGGRRDPRSGTTVPAEAGVEAAKKFVEENKK